jgi:hypothetical protein
VPDKVESQQGAGAPYTTSAMHIYPLCIEQADVDDVENFLDISPGSRYAGIGHWKVMMADGNPVSPHMRQQAAIGFDSVLHPVIHQIHERCYTNGAEHSQARALLLRRPAWAGMFAAHEPGVPHGEPAWYVTTGIG